MRTLFICVEHLSSENTSVCQDTATVSSLEVQLLLDKYQWTHFSTSPFIPLQFKQNKEILQRESSPALEGSLSWCSQWPDTPSRKLQKLLKADQQRRWWQGGFLSPDHLPGISHKKGWNVADSYSVFLTQCMRMSFNILAVTCANKQLCWLRDGLSSPALFNSFAFQSWHTIQLWALSLI